MINICDISLMGYYIMTFILPTISYKLLETMKKQKKKKSLEFWNCPEMSSATTIH